MNWFENQSDTVKGLIVLILAVAVSTATSWCSNSHAKGFRFIGTSSKIKVPHVKSARPRVSVKGLRR